MRTAVWEGSWVKNTRAALNTQLTKRAAPLSPGGQASQTSRRHTVTRGACRPAHSAICLSVEYLGISPCPHWGDRPIWIATCMQKTFCLTVLRTTNKGFPMQNPSVLDVCWFAFEFWVQLHFPWIVLLRNLTMLLKTVCTAKGKGLWSDWFENTAFGSSSQLGYCVSLPWPS